MTINIPTHTHIKKTYASVCASRIIQAWPGAGPSTADTTTPHPQQTQKHNHKHQQKQQQQNENTKQQQ